MALSLVMAHSAAAQVASQTENSDTETVVVTGTKKVISTPEQIKVTNTGIVDSITADQIESLPDQSLPEVLDRVVGVSSDIGYNTSQAQYVTVRGFDSRYNSADVDGNPIWNSSRNNRGAQLDMFPSTSVAQVNVYKTVTPDQDPNSIGGHIELRTLRAFDGGDQPYFKVRAELGDYSQSRVEQDSGIPSYLFGAVGKDTFGDQHQFGFVFGVDAQQNMWHDKYSTVTGYSQINNTDVINGSIFPGIYDDTVTRLGVYGKLEAHATDQFYAFVSAAFYEERENNQEFRTGPFLTATAVKGAAQNVGTFTNVPDEAYLETYLFNRREVLLGSGVDYRINDTDQINFRAGWTNYFDYENDETGERFEAPTVSGTYDLSENNPGTTLTLPATTGDPNNWVYRNKNASAQKILPNTDNVYNANLAYNSNNYPAAHGFGFAIGTGFRELLRNFNQTQNSYTLPAGKSVTLAQFVPAGTALNGISPAIINPVAFWNYMQTNGTLSVNPSQTADYHLLEDVYAGYAEVTYGWGPLHALAGFRVENTQSVDNTSNQVGTTITPETYRVHYTNWLPNVQASYDATDALRFRASYNETIARPDFKDYAMGQTVSTDANGKPLISGTNPYLTPRVSFNYDLSAEYYAENYFGSIGLFHKTLKKDEFSQQFQQFNSAGNVILTQTIPLNTGSASDDGLELNYVQNHADFLPKPFDGLHWSGNYTRIIGKWDVFLSNGQPRTVDGLRNQPSWLGNVEVGYTWGPLDVTAAVRFRGHTFTGTFGTTSAGDVYINPYTRLDLQADYHIMKGLDAFVDVKNLNNAYLSETTGIQNSFDLSVDSGRSIFFGIKYKPDFNE